MRREDLLGVAETRNQARVREGRGPGGVSVLRMAKKRTQRAVHRRVGRGTDNADLALAHGHGDTRPHSANALGLPRARGPLDETHPCGREEAACARLCLVGAQGSANRIDLVREDRDSWAVQEGAPIGTALLEGGEREAVIERGAPIWGVGEPNQRLRLSDVDMLRDEEHAIAEVAKEEAGSRGV